MAVIRAPNSWPMTSLGALYPVRLGCDVQMARSRLASISSADLKQFGGASPIEIRKNFDTSFAAMIHLANWRLSRLALK